jgi:hypothetical protein
MSTINITNKLPPDVTMHMLSFSTPTDLTQNIEKTSTSLYKLSNAPLLWKMMALDRGIKVKPEQSAKNAVLAYDKNCEELNRIFFSTIEYLRGLTTSHTKFKDYHLKEIPIASDPYEQYKKIVRWCSEDILETARQSNEDPHTAKTSTALSLLQFFNTCPHLVSIYQIPTPPQDIYDHRLLDIFVEGNPQVEPKEIHFLH